MASNPDKFFYGRDGEAKFKAESQLDLADKAKEKEWRHVFFSDYTYKA